MITLDYIDDMVYLNDKALYVDDFLNFFTNPRLLGGLPHSLLPDNNGWGCNNDYNLYYHRYKFWDIIFIYQADISESFFKRFQDIFQECGHVYRLLRWSCRKYSIEFLYWFIDEFEIKYIGHDRERWINQAVTYCLGHQCINDEFFKKYKKYIDIYDNRLYEFNVFCKLLDDNTLDSYIKNWNNKEYIKMICKYNTNNKVSEEFKQLHKEYFCG